MQGITGNNGYGAAWVFVHHGSSWVQEEPKLTGRGETEEGLFGAAVAVSGDGNTVLIGGFNANGRGAAWIFERSRGAWKPQSGKLVATSETGQAVHEFGGTVALSGDGDTALISDGDNNNDVGTVWVYLRHGSVWRVQRSKLTPNDESGPGQFGTALTLSADGNTALISGWYDHHGLGAAWEFTRVGDTWEQQGAKLTGQKEIGSDSRFGTAVALATHPLTALIGGALDNNKRGAVWAFNTRP
jgi:hypothetical protein